VREENEKMKGRAEMKIEKEGLSEYRNRNNMRRRKLKENGSTVSILITRHLCGEIRSSN
jgi:hypothetical protein